jgi:hypothetical protein
MNKPKDYRTLLGTENAKTTKGEDLGYRTGILYLAPASEAGIGNLCPMASKGCRTACLFTAGRGRMDNVKNARIDKTLFWYHNREAFFCSLIYDIECLVKSCRKSGQIPAIRLNGTSDIIWERQLFQGRNIFDMFPDVQFYDYTKIWTRFNSRLPPNYHLTFSRSEENDAKVDWIISNHSKVNVAVVFSGDLPKKYKGRKVINADDHDLRFLDRSGVICGLKAKGDGKKDKSGFVVNQ